MTRDFGIGPFRDLIKWAALVIVFIALGLLVGFYFALVVSVLLVAIFADISSRVPYMTALVLLVLSALFLALSYQSFSNWLANISYYALAIGILIDFYDFLRSGVDMSSIPPNDWK